ncbi:hypothetical protein M8818_007726 [Zalaria obscura]|uniref:Uncharacterized protein n=1 Tax=Zalaria obscura TaxID=2024903 RepID=A0ACC3S305_9PEZI
MNSTFNLYIVAVHRTYILSYLVPLAILSITFERSKQAVHLPPAHKNISTISVERTLNKTFQVANPSWRLYIRWLQFSFIARYGMSGYTNCAQKTSTDSRHQPMQVENNYKRAEAFIRSAAQQGAQLAVLPEYHLTNWVPHDPGFKEACGQWRIYLEKYQALAKELNISIVPGTIVELHRDEDGSTLEGKNSDESEGNGDETEAKGERLINVAYFIGPDGSILGRYQKKNLWGSIERLHLTSSSRDLHPVLDTPLGKVGMLICWDLAFPEAFREMIAQGAKLIIIPTFWTMGDCSKEGLARNPSAEGLFLDSILTARCFENTCAIIFANAGGPPGKGYAGLTQVCAPYVGPLVRMGSAAEGMAVVDLDMQIVEDAEENYQVRADLAKADWHYDYRHSKDTKDAKL